MRAPLISVVIPAYNAAGTIGDALRSVLLQSFSDWEAIVVDDGSTDGTESAARTACPAARVIRQPNAGPGAARNRGIRESRGEWIAFLDSDDAWLPWRLADQMEVAALFPDAILIAAGETAFDDAAVRRVPPTAGLCREVSVAEFVDGTPIWTDTVLVRKDAVTRIGGFDETLRGPEDYDLWMRLAASGRIVRFEAPVARYRARCGSLSMDSRRFLPQALKACEKAFGPGGVLYPHRAFKRRRLATLYAEAAWSRWRDGRRGAALWTLARSWFAWPRRLKVEMSSPLWRASLLARIVLTRPPTRDL